MGDVTYTAEDLDAIARLVEVVNELPEFDGEIDIVIRSRHGGVVGRVERLDHYDGAIGYVALP